MNTYLANMKFKTGGYYVHTINADSQEAAEASADRHVEACMGEIKRDGLARLKTWPKPTRQRMDVAEAHRALSIAAQDLADDSANWSLAARKVFKAEARRQASLVGGYRYRYGPNAHI